MRGHPSNSVRTQKMKTGGKRGRFCDKKNGMLCLIQCMKAGSDGGPLHMVLLLPDPSTGNSLGQTVLGMSRTQMLIKGTNQEQTSFQNTCRRRYKHQLPGTFG